MTKGKIKEKDNSLKIKGFANYVYNFEKKVIIHEYLEIIEANYRLTDKAMLKPTSYYKQPSVKKIRNDFFDQITNYDCNNIIKSTFHNLEEEQINEVNKYLKLEAKTIKQQFSYFQGSNIKGAKTNTKASPLVCIDQEYFGCNFANPMKELLDQKYNLNYKIIKEMSLAKFINDKDYFRNIFQKYNIWYFENIYDYDLNKIHSKTTFNNSPEEIIESWKKIPQNLDDQISEYIELYFKGIWAKDVKDTKKYHTKTLRRLYGLSVKREIKNGNIPFLSSKNYYDPVLIQNAHIINFSKLVQEDTKESILKAISPFNVLRIDLNNHTLFDNHRITFDLKGNSVSYNNKTFQESFLDIEKLHDKTISFIKENWKHWQTNKSNK